MFIPQKSSTRLSSFSTTVKQSFNSITQEMYTEQHKTVVNGCVRETLKTSTVAAAAAEAAENNNKNLQFFKKMFTFTAIQSIVHR